MNLDLPTPAIHRNYKGESYFEHSTLFDYLNNLCEILEANMLSHENSYLVKDLLAAPDFNKRWQVTPNNPNNPRSKNEYKGIYAFASVMDAKVNFMYVGISQTIRRRFYKHTLRNRKNEASWAYLMAKHHHPDLSISDRQLKIPDYQRQNIHPIRFSFCLIDDNMLMHIAEVYCANRLRSHWNTFETH